MLKLIEALFETNALRVCPDGQPFWYTSGTIGPYYINTHFLYGSEREANELLALIDEAAREPDGCSARVAAAAMAQYEKNAVYRGTIDEIVSAAKALSPGRFAAISGGERRDWFFSLPAAILLKKPHITIFKNGGGRLFDGTASAPVPDLGGGVDLHIADLVTEGSSHVRAWIPAVRGFGGKMTASISVVDRNQGGADILREHGVEPHALVTVDSGLFEAAERIGRISPAQRAMLEAFREAPHGAMRAFLLEHPEFLQNALQSDQKTAQRAKLCIEQDLYHLQ